MNLATKVMNEKSLGEYPVFPNQSSAMLATYMWIACDYKVIMQLVLCLPMISSLIEISVKFSHLQPVEN